MMDDALPEPDRLDGAPHPRDTAGLLGQARAEAEVLDALTSDRMHHAWLLTGPRGVGKATLAWRIARFLLTEAPADAGLFGAPQPPTSLDTDPAHPVLRRLAAGSEARLFLLRRAWDADKKRLKSVITVDETRKLRSFFGLSATDGGRRVVIVDSVDEMNVNAANALLKLLEEPPARAVFLLISHQPARLLATIRSRCRELRLETLGPDDIATILDRAEAALPDNPAALAELASGSAGAAISLSLGGGLELYAHLLTLLSQAPLADRPAQIKLAETLGARGKDAQIDLLMRLTAILLTRAAQTGAGRPPTTEAAEGEAATLRRVAPDLRAAQAWAECQQVIDARMAHGRAVNLDASGLILDMVLKINETASDILSRQ